MEEQDRTPEPEAPETEVIRSTTAGQAHTFGMLCHLSALVTYIGIPFGNVIGPLIIWLVKKDDHEFIDDQGREAINFQITVTLAMIASGILCIILVGLPLLFLVLIASFVLTLIGAVKASTGERYRYPFSIRLLR